MGDISNLQALSRGGDDMFERMIEEIQIKILEALERYLKSHEKIPPRIIGLIFRKIEVQEELDIKYLTLQKWERMGLNALSAPGDDSRKVYYKVDDIYKFMGVYDGKN